MPVPGWVPVPVPRPLVHRLWTCCEVIAASSRGDLRGEEGQVAVAWRRRARLVDLGLDCCCCCRSRGRWVVAAAQLPHPSCIIVGMARYGRAFEGKDEERQTIVRSVYKHGACR